MQCLSEHQQNYTVKQFHADKVIFLLRRAVIVARFCAACLIAREGTE